METLTTTHFKALKRILRYIKGIVYFGLFYGYSNSFELISYNDSDWAEDMNDRKSIASFVFHMGDTIFTWSSTKQPIVTLSTCEAEYIVTTTYVYLFIWLRRLLKELRMSHKKLYVDNSSTIALVKNLVFHERSKHIDIRFHYLQDCITNKKVEVKHVKTQNQIANIFSKPLKYDVFAKIRDMLGVIKKSSLMRDVESKLEFSFSEQ